MLPPLSIIISSFPSTYLTTMSVNIPSQMTVSFRNCSLNWEFSFYAIKTSFCKIVLYTTEGQCNLMKEKTTVKFNSQEMLPKQYIL